MPIEIYKCLLFRKSYSVNSHRCDFLAFFNQVNNLRGYETQNDQFLNDIVIFECLKITIYCTDSRNLGASNLIFLKLVQIHSLIMSAKFHAI